MAAGTAAQLVVDAPRFVPLGTENEEPACSNHIFVILFRGRSVHLVHFGPIRFRDFEFLALIVEAQKTFRRGWIDGAFGDADGARTALLHQFLARHEVGVAAEQNVGAAAGHVGRNGDHPKSARLRDDLRFAFVELRVQHDVPHAFALEDSREQLALLDRRGADEHRLLLFVQFGDLIRDRFIFFLRGAEHDIGILEAQHRLVGGNHDDFEFVDLLELGGFGLGRARHAAQLLDRGESNSGR